MIAQVKIQGQPNCTVYVLFESKYQTSEVHVDFDMLYIISRKSSLILRPEYKECLAGGWAVAPTYT